MKPSEGPFIGLQFLRGPFPRFSEVFTGPLQFERGFTSSSQLLWVCQKIVDCKSKKVLSAEMCLVVDQDGPPKP